MTVSLGHSSMRLSSCDTDFRVPNRRAEQKAIYEIIRYIHLFVIYIHIYLYTFILKSRCFLLKPSVILTLTCIALSSRIHNVTCWENIQYLCYTIFILNCNSLISNINYSMKHNKCFIKILVNSWVSLLILVFISIRLQFLYCRKLFYIFYIYGGTSYSISKCYSEWKIPLLLLLYVNITCCFVTVTNAIAASVSFLCFRFAHDSDLDFAQRLLLPIGSNYPLYRRIKNSSSSERVHVSRSGTLSFSFSHSDHVRTARFPRVR